MNIEIPFVSNIPEYIDTYVQPRFAATINGDPYTLEGKTKIFKDTRETIFNISSRTWTSPSTWPTSRTT